MRKAEHTEQVGIPMLGFVSAKVAHKRRFMHLKPNIRRCTTIFFVIV